MKNIHRRIIFSIIISAIVTFIGYFGTRFNDSMANNYNIVYTPFDFIIPIIILITTSLITYFLLGIRLKLKEDKNYKLKRWHIFVPLFITSTIMLLAMYPGHHTYDSYIMYHQTMTSHVSTHYTPFITVFIGLFLAAGKVLLGSMNLGCAIMVFLQATFIDFALTEAIFYCANKLKKNSFGILFAMFFVFNPLVQMTIIRTGQDTLFGGLILLLCLELLKFSEDKDYFKDRGKKIVLFILIFFICLTRNNGFFMLIPFAIASFFALKNHSLHKEFFITIGTPIIAFLAFNAFIVNPLVPDKESLFHETISIPSMQIARALYFNPDKEIEEELKKYYDDPCETWLKINWDWRKYNKSAAIADPYKNCSNSHTIENDFLGYLSVWARLGLKDPAKYIEAPFVFMTGLYYPYVEYGTFSDENGVRSPQWHTYIENYNQDLTIYTDNDVKDENFIPLIKIPMDEFMEDQHWSKVPVAHLFWHGSFAVYVCILAIILALYRRKYHFIVPLSLIFGLILTVALSPIMLYRYIFPAVLCIPIMFYILKKTMIK